jgi:YHS domain-containing protein
MKRTIIYLSVALGVLATYSCNNTANTEEGTSTETATNTDAATDMTDSIAKPVNLHISQLATDQDFVCGMKLTDEMIADTTSVDGKVYGFCSQECKAQFAQDPQKFLSKK